MAQDDKCPRITDKFLNKLLSSDFRMYYNTRDLNDRLFLHYKGFKKIENMEEFTGLKVLYIEGNAIEKIEGLEKCTELRCLYLQENYIHEISGLETLANLHTLNLSDNMIASISGLACCPNLETLLLQRNILGKNGVEDIEELLNLPKISVLDITFNQLESQENLIEIIYKMPSLSVLYLQGNPVCKSIKNYRKEIIVNIAKLKYLDDRPVFVEDRRFAEAFARGGLQEEREEMIKWNKEKEDEQIRNHNEFREMIEKSRAEREQKRFEEMKSSGDASASGGLNLPQIWVFSDEHDAENYECSTPSSVGGALLDDDVNRMDFEDAE